jgi:hypothetical protein
MRYAIFILEYFDDPDVFFTIWSNSLEITYFKTIWSNCESKHLEIRKKNSIDKIEMINLTNLNMFNGKNWFLGISYYMLKFFKPKPMVHYIFVIILQYKIYNTLLWHHSI